MPGQSPTLFPPPHARLRHAALFPPAALPAGPLAWSAVRRRWHELKAGPAPGIVAWQPPRNRGRLPAWRR